MIRVYKNGAAEVWQVSDTEFVAYFEGKWVGDYTLKSRAIEALQRW